MSMCRMKSKLEKAMDYLASLPFLYECEDCGGQFEQLELGFANKSIILCEECLQEYDYA